jgi:hypothetical protein
MSVSGYKCPKCGCSDVYRSRRHGFDRIISLFGFYPFICEERLCRNRFYRRNRQSVQPQVLVSPNSPVAKAQDRTRSQ